MKTKAMKISSLIILIVLISISSVYGIVVDGLNTEWNSSTSINDSGGDAATDFDNITKMYWFADDESIYIAVDRKNYTAKGKGNAYKDYETVVGDTLETDYGYVGINHQSGKVDYYYDAEYLIDIAVNGVGGMEVDVYYNILEEELEIKVYDEGSLVHSRTYSNQQQSTFTEIEIPLEVFEERFYSGYEIEFAVSSASDRSPDNGFIIISSIPTSGAILTIGLLIFALIVIYYKLKRDKETLK